MLKLMLILNLKLILKLNIELIIITKDLNIKELKKY
jgi:hypothetical protein